MTRNLCLYDVIVSNMIVGGKVFRFISTELIVGDNLKVSGVTCANQHSVSSGNWKYRGSLDGSIFMRSEVFLAVGLLF